MQGKVFLALAASVLIVKVHRISGFTDNAGWMDRTDPFVQLMYGKQKSKTKVKNNAGGNAEFNEVFFFGIIPADANGLEIAAMVRPLPRSHTLTLSLFARRPSASVADCAPKFPFAGLAQRTHHQAQVHGHTHLRVLMITHDIARAWGPVMCTDAFFEQICIRIVRDLMDIRVNERDHPKILMWLLLPLYPSLAHSRAMRAHFICAFVSARMCSLCYDRIRKKRQTMRPCQKHNPRKCLSPKTARKRCFFIMMHQIGGREGAEVGEFMRTIRASSWNTGFTVTLRHLSYYKRRAGC